MSRTSVAGNAWLQVWIPALLRGRTARVVRVAPLVHRGELLGLIVVERASDGSTFTDDEDGTIVDLGRQVGLALHNVRLDAELQASLRELEVRNVELQASRARIVHTADESRRQIERNLHDGVQQHLVAMAVKLRIARQLAPSDAERAESLLQEVAADVETTLDELRELAHGIYPPLLRERGLGEALRAVANRSPLPLRVGVDGVGRYPVEVEAAVYFCCLEAIQNAGKHAGADASIALRVAEDRGRLMFSVADDGNGFDTAGPVGHGFVNMRDRLGAIGGQLTLTSSPGAGATVEGTVPLPRPATNRRG
jgi:signal transduction histidine kinase